MSLLSPSLIAFLAVVRRSTVLDAAKDLNITQTAVTQRIKILETNMGVTLFLRSRRGMLLTKDGEALLQYCRASQELEGLTMSRLSTAGKKADLEFSIGAPSSLIQTRVLPRLAKVMTAFPNLRLTIVATDETDPIEKLKSGQADLVFVHPNSVSLEMDSKMVAPERYILVGQYKWKRRPLAEIVKSERIVDFNESDKVTFDFLSKCRLLKSARKDRHFANNTLAIYDLVTRGFGYTALPEEYVRPALRTKTLGNLANEHSLELSFAMAWYPRPVMPAYFKTIVEALK